MNKTGRKELLQIKKYPNRRYYDASRSQHVTLQEVYEAIVAGNDVIVTDSKTGEDITNLVLLQVMLEKDQPKLDLFPASILHWMIRSNRRAIRTWMDRYFGPVMTMLATSQRQFDSYLRNTLGTKFVSPMDRASAMMNAFTGASTADVDADVKPESDPAEHDAESDPPFPASEFQTQETMEELRAQVEDLNRRLETISRGRSRTNGTKPGKEDSAQ
ncbi:MAG: polyhydroxyalkanoate synthesis regulator DNA-binding domain-containing protein [Planctomycetota bacterium]